VCRPLYPERVVEKSVDDWIDEAVGHGQPVHAVVQRDEEPLLRRRLVVGAAGASARSRPAASWRWRQRLVVGELRVEVDDEHEGVQRQPTDAEQRHDHHQHLDHLSTITRYSCGRPRGVLASK